MADHFSEAAVRHYIDGRLLHQSNRYDNAMCHYAFSAECAIKAFKEQFRHIYPVHNRATHAIEPVWKSMTEYYELLGILDAQLSMLIGIGAPPSVLFQGHPGRRYENDIAYADSELSACENFAAELVQRVVDAAIDGKLQYES